MRGTICTPRMAALAYPVSLGQLYPASPGSAVAIWPHTIGTSCMAALVVYGSTGVPRRHWLYGGTICTSCTAAAAYHLVVDDAALVVALVVGRERRRLCQVLECILRQPRHGSGASHAMVQAEVQHPPALCMGPGPACRRAGLRGSHSCCEFSDQDISRASRGGHEGKDAAAYEGEDTTGSLCVFTRVKTQESFPPSPCALRS
jgi:hypothetical protein